MLGIFFIYWIGKAFYALAEANGRNNWLWAILGVVSFYAFQFVFGIIFYLAVYKSVDEIPDRDKLVDVAGIIIGGLSCYWFYHLLKKQWAKVKINSDPNMLDSDLVN